MERKWQNSRKATTQSHRSKVKKTMIARLPHSREVHSVLVKKNNLGENKLVKEWMELIKIAKEIGIPKDEVRKFLSDNNRKSNPPDKSTN